MKNQGEGRNDATNKFSQIKIFLNPVVKDGHLAWPWIPYKYSQRSFSEFTQIIMLVPIEVKVNIYFCTLCKWFAFRIWMRIYSRLDSKDKYQTMKASSWAAYKTNSIALKKPPLATIDIITGLMRILARSMKITFTLARIVELF